MKRLAYIPARGGSKGVPRKNIRLLDGKPLVAYTIEAAKGCGLFEKILVSTDDGEIAEIAREFGAWVPFLRDASAAADTSSSIEAICADKKKLEAMGLRFDSLCLLQPTSPLRSAKDIIKAYGLFEKKRQGVVSLCEVEECPYLMRTVNSDGSVGHLLSLRGAIRRQDLPVYYRLNGAIYINAWDELTPMLTQADNPYGYIMSAESSVDIDSERDFALVEEIMKKRDIQNET